MRGGAVIPPAPLGLLLGVLIEVLLGVPLEVLLGVLRGVLATEEAPSSRMVAR